MQEQHLSFHHEGQRDWTQVFEFLPSEPSHLHWVATILSRSFVSVFIRKIQSVIFLFVVSLPTFGIRVILASLKGFGSVPFFSILQDKLRSTNVSSFFIQKFHFYLFFCNFTHLYNVFRSHSSHTFLQLLTSPSTHPSQPRVVFFLRNNPPSSISDTYVWMSVGPLEHGWLPWSLSQKKIIQ